MFWYFLFFLIKHCTRGYQKGLSLMQWNQYLLSYAVENIKQKMFYQLWKLDKNTLIINHFIIKYILHGMVTRSIQRGVPGLFHSVIFLNVNLYTLIHFLARYKVKYQLKQSYFHAYWIWWIVEWIWQCFTKKWVQFDNVSIKNSIFPTLTQSRNNVT